MGAEPGEEEAAHVAIVVLAGDLPGIAIAVGAHELVKLLPYGIHGERATRLGFWFGDGGVGCVGGGEAELEKGETGTSTPEGPGCLWKT